jgi:hypothetical protein
VLELRLKSGSVVAFDGRVIEIFSTGASRRLHVGGLTEPEIREGPSGGRILVLDAQGLELHFAPEEASACARLAAALSDALAADTRFAL